MLALIVGVAPASAHTPNQNASGWDPWDWTCYAGDGPSQDPGTCYRHHSNAVARVYFENIPSNWLQAVKTGKNAWDKTNGHQFDFDRQGTDTTANSNVRVVAANPCGTSAAKGCASLTKTTNSHILEGMSYIELSNGAVGAPLRNDVAAHEFGHLMAAGHSAEFVATMGPVLQDGQSTLHAVDRAARCQIYGHSGHNWWGGC